MRYVLTISLLMLSLLVANAQVQPDYFLQKAVKSYKDKDYKMATDNARRTINVDSSAQQAYYILSASYLQQGKWAEGISSAQLGLKYLPNAVELHWLLAEGALQSKKFQLAATHYEQVKNSFSGQKKLSGDINIKKLNQRLGECYTQMGNTAMEQGNKKLALIHFKEANQLLVDNVFSYVNLAFAYANLAQWDNSLIAAENGLAKFPDNDGLIKAKASALYHKKDYSGVEKEYKKLHEIHPNDIDIAIAYGELLMGNQQFQKASELYNQLLKKHPDEQKVYESLIASYEARMNYEGKVEILRQMLPYFDKKAIYQRIATTYEEIEQWTKARKYYDTLLSLQPDHAFEIEQKLAATYLQQDSLDQAALSYEALHRRQPENTTVLENLARTYEKAQRWQEALKMYRQLEALKKSEKVYTKLGKVNYKLENEAAALKYYQMSLAASQNTEALLGLSKIIKNHQRDSALHMAQQAFRLAFKMLEGYEKKLNGKENNSIAGLVKNKDLLKEIEAHEALATEAFYHFTSFGYDKVQEQVAKLTSDFPKSARVYYLVGEFYYKNGLQDKSLELLKRSVALNPNFKETQMLLGAIYEQRGQYYQGILSYERALTLDPKDDSIYAHLIRLYRSYDKLDLLCEKWLVKYEASENQDILKPHLIEALHKAGKFEMAQKVIEEKI